MRRPSIVTTIRILVLLAGTLLAVRATRLADPDAALISAVVGTVLIVAVVVSVLPPNTSEWS